MSDLTDEELTAASTRHDRLAAINVNAYVVPEALTSAALLQRAALELQRHRAAQRADAERVKAVVTEAFLSKLAWHGYSGALGINRDTIADAIAVRVAEQLADRSPAVPPAHERIRTIVREVLLSSCREQGSDVDTDADGWRFLTDVVALRIADRIVAEMLVQVPAVPLTAGEVKHLRHRLQDWRVTVATSAQLVERLLAGATAPVLGDEDRGALNYLVGWANASLYMGDVKVEPDRLEAGVAALDRLLGDAR